MSDVTHVQADPKRPYKAYVSAAATAVVTFIYLWIEDKGGRHGFTSEELFENIGAALLASGLVGVPTFLKKNPKVLKPATHRNERGAVTRDQLILALVIAAVVIALFFFVILPAARHA